MTNMNAQPRRMTLSTLAGAINGVDNLVIVCGAGLSFGVAPLAQSVEDGMLAAAAQLSIESAARDVQTIIDAALEVRQPYFTLELFASGLRHRVPELTDALSALYRELFTIVEPNRAHLALAKAMKNFVGKSTKRRATVLTSNFDDGLTRGLERCLADYRLVTDANVAGALANPFPGAASGSPGAPQIDVCAYHGTVQVGAPGQATPTGPTSIAARDLAHPFAPDMSAYIRKTLNQADLVLFIGHRGEDFYDLNLEIRHVVDDHPDPQERERSLRRFLCVPHLGDFGSVSHFYESTFTRSGFVILEDGGNDWIAELSDLVSGVPTPAQSSSGAADARAVAAKMIAQVTKLHAVGSSSREAIGMQCAALLQDIVGGVLAAWSVIEHYRLESIGYEQDIISAFARPPVGRKFYEVNISELIDLQRDYQIFRADFGSSMQRGTAVGDAISLSARLEHFAMSARGALQKAPAGVHKAVAAVLAAIAFDYAGLVAMRLREVNSSPYLPDPSDKPRVASLLQLLESTSATALLNGAVAGETYNQQELRADRLFKLSVKLAQRAGNELRQEAARYPHQIGYEDELAQIVGWEDWQLAPAENRLRLQCDTLDQRISQFGTLVEARISRIQKQQSFGQGRSFSAAGDAAQCAQRLAEIVRLIAMVGPTGKPTVPPAASLTPTVATILAHIPGYAKTCIKAAAETSSVPNYRLLSAYDALVLVELLENNIVGAEAACAEAEVYASNQKRREFAVRLAQIRSRLR